MNDLTRLMTPPQVEPVTLDEAKQYLRLDGSDLDARTSASYREPGSCASSSLVGPSSSRRGRCELCRVL